MPSGHCEVVRHVAVARDTSLIHSFMTDSVVIFTTPSSQVPECVEDVDGLLEGQRKISAVHDSL
jgi:hypothetical protein